MNDVVMMSSEDGRLLKLINTSRGRHQLHPIVVEVLQVFSQPVVHIHIHGPSASRRQNRYGGQDYANEGRDSAAEPKEKVLVVASRIDIVQMPVQRCHTQTSCRQAASFFVFIVCTGIVLWTMRISFCGNGHTVRNSLRNVQQLPVDSFSSNTTVTAITKNWLKKPKMKNDDNNKFRMELKVNIRSCKFMKII